MSFSFKIFFGAVPGLSNDARLSVTGLRKKKINIFVIFTMKLFNSNKRTVYNKIMSDN